MVPVVIMALFAPEIKLGPFYAALFSNKSGDQWVTWLVLLAPYVLIQVGRSVLWAYRTLKENTNA